MWKENSSMSILRRSVHKCTIFWISFFIAVTIYGEEFSLPDSACLEVVYKYAPIIYQEISPDEKLQIYDFITSVDYDNDFQANNNEENITKFQLPATLYYSVLETKTHYFVNYSIYHPLDWSRLPWYFPYTWHENDMENIQVVIEKRENQPCNINFLITQAHLKSSIYSAHIQIRNHFSRVEKESILQLDTNLTKKGFHPVLYIEKGGHGIHNALSVQKKFSQLNPPKLKHQFVFLPSNSVQSYYEKGKYIFKYQLVNIYKSFWIPYLQREIIGNGKLMDGEFDYSDNLFNFKGLPRFFDSNRWSGPFKKDSGISPFAFSFSLLSKDLGILFFNPAKKYKDVFGLRDGWSTDYIFNPYCGATIKD